MIMETTGCGVSSDPYFASPENSYRFYAVICYGVRLDEMELHITDLMKYGGNNTTNKIVGNGDSDLGDSFNFGSSGLPEG